MPTDAAPPDVACDAPDRTWRGVRRFSADCYTHRSHGRPRHDRRLAAGAASSARILTVALPHATSLPGRRALLTAGLGLFLFDAAHFLAYTVGRFDHPVPWYLGESLASSWLDVAALLLVCLHDVCFAALALVAWTAVATVLSLPRRRASRLATGAALALPLAVYLASGDGVRRLVTPWLAAPALALGAGAARRTVRRLLARPPNQRGPLLRWLAVATGVGLLLVDERLLPGLYAPLHLGAAAAGVICFEWAARRPGAGSVRPYLPAALGLAGLTLAPLGRGALPAIHTVAVQHGTGVRHDSRLAFELVRLATPRRTPAPPPASAGKGVSWQGPAPHVLVIGWDGVRHDATSLARSPRFPGHDTTPFLKRLAATGVSFDRAYSPTATTYTSLATVFTSELTLREGKPCQRVRRERPDLLPDVFRRAGYATLCDFPYAGSHLDCLAAGCESVRDSRDRRRMFAGLLDWLATNDRPTFAFLHLTETHDPYVGWDDDLASRTPGWTAYERSVRGVDEATAAFHATVEATSRRPVVWVLLSDHGEGLGDHGYRMHDASVHESQVRVPLVLAGLPVPSRRVTEPVGLAWLFDTLRPLARTEPKGPTLPVLGAAPARRVFLATRRWVGVVDGRFKYVEDRGTGAAWLFDLETDPGETLDAASRAPGLRDELGRALRDRFPD